MGKSRVRAGDGDVPHKSSGDHEHALDPDISLLFASSLGPVKPASKSQNHPTVPIHTDKATSSAFSTLSQINEVSDEQTGLQGNQNRKRKRKLIEDDVEGKYMRQLAQEEIRGEAKSSKVAKSLKLDCSAGAVNGGTLAEHERDSGHKSETNTAEEGATITSGSVPKHVSVSTLGNPEKNEDLDKAKRTVFLANVSTLAIRSKNAKKTLLDHLTSIIPNLPDQHLKHAIESIRFRSIAFAINNVPKKAAYARKDLMDSTTKSTNAYAVYTTQTAAREAMQKLNGTMVLDRHLRVDSVAHPAKQDHRRCIFVGNLGFVDEESSVKAVEDESRLTRPRNSKAAADVEEGLWRQFSKAGELESVRVVRDKTTRVGKGFAYVQFRTANAVEKALLYDGKKFPPMLPRVLRVTRAKSPPKRVDHERRTTKEIRTTNLRGKLRKTQTNPSASSLSGRAGKLLGRAGAAHLRNSERSKRYNSKPSDLIPKASPSVNSDASQTVAGDNYPKLGPGKRSGKPSERSREFAKYGRKSKP